MLTSVESHREETFSGESHKDWRKGYRVILFFLRDWIMTLGRGQLSQEFVKSCLRSNGVGIST